MGGEVFLEMFNTKYRYEGCTVLHLAAFNGQLSMCTFLVDEMKFNINVKTYKGETPVVLAAKIDGHSTVKYLIENKADIHLSNHEGGTPLHYVVGNDNTMLLNMLLDCGANIEVHCVGGTPLHIAARDGNDESLKILLRNKVKANSISKFDSSSALVCAIINDNVGCVKLLLEAGADVNFEHLGMRPLAHAAINFKDCIHLLLEKGADPKYP